MTLFELGIDEAMIELQITVVQLVQVVGWKNWKL